MFLFVGTYVSLCLCTCFSISKVPIWLVQGSTCSVKILVEDLVLILMLPSFFLVVADVQSYRKLPSLLIRYVH